MNEDNQQALVPEQTSAPFQNDQPRHDATDDALQNDMARHDAPSDETRRDEARHVSSQAQNDLQNFIEVQNEIEARYSLTSNEAAQIFNERGMHRSKRTVERMCHKRQLDCAMARSPLNTKVWLIDQNSVEKKINELEKAAAIFENATKGDTPRHDTRHDATVNAPESDTIRHDATANETRRDEARHYAPEHDANTEREIKDLRRELENERILRKAREYHSEFLESQNKSFIEQLRRDALVIGEAKQKLMQLGAPQEDIARLTAPAEPPPQYP